MSKMVKKTSGGGVQFIVAAIVSFPIFIIGFAALDTGPLGFFVWLLFLWFIKKAVQEEVEERFPEEMRDEIAEEHFRLGRPNAKIVKRGWGKGVIPLPNKLTTEYFFEEEDD